jgi:hypothetical protein
MDETREDVLMGKKISNKRLKLMICEIFPKFNVFRNLKMNERNHDSYKRLLIHFNFYRSQSMTIFNLMT